MHTDSAPPPARFSTLLAVAAGVLGLTATMFALLPPSGILGCLPALAAMGTGAAAMARHTRWRAVAIAGIVTGALSFAIVVSNNPS